MTPTATSSSHRRSSARTATRSSVREQRLLPHKWEPWELRMLVKCYAQERSPTPARRRECARTLAARRCEHYVSTHFETAVENYERRVTNWFKNRRAKEKHGRLKPTQDVGDMNESSAYPYEEDTRTIGVDCTSPTFQGKCAVCCRSRALTSPGEACHSALQAAACQRSEYNCIDKYDMDDDQVRECKDTAQCSDDQFAPRCSHCKFGDVYKGVEPHYVGASGILMFITYSESFERGK